MSKKFNKCTKKFNLRQSKEPIKIDASSIPDTISSDAKNEWIGEDKDPYYKIQKIEYPIKANGDIYVESFFQSFINSLKDAPIPGAKDGHVTQWGARGNTDFIMSGAKLESNGDGTGAVFFKNYIPKENNETFIKELNSNMIEFSLVAYVKEERIDKGDGEVEYHVTEAISGFRNDAVDVGAMEQKLNNKNLNIEKGEGMTKEEILKGLLTLKTNNGVDLPEIAKHLNLDSLLITDEQTAGIAKLNAIATLCGGKDPVEMITELQASVKQNADSVRAAKISEEFGPKEWDDTKKENKGRMYAEQVLGDKELTAENIKEIKENSLYVSLAAERAVASSEENDLGESVGGKEKKTNGIKVEEY